MLHTRSETGAEINSEAADGKPSIETAIAEENDTNTKIEVPSEETISEEKVQKEPIQDQSPIITGEEKKASSSEARAETNSEAADGKSSTETTKEENNTNTKIEEPSGETISEEKVLKEPIQEHGPIITDENTGGIDKSSPKTSISEEKDNSYWKLSKHIYRGAWR